MKKSKSQIIAFKKNASCLLVFQLLTHISLAGSLSHSQKSCLQYYVLPTAISWNSAFLKERGLSLYWQEVLKNQPPDSENPTGHFFVARPSDMLPAELPVETKLFIERYKNIFKLSRSWADSQRILVDFRMTYSRIRYESKYAALSITANEIIISATDSNRVLAGERFKQESNELWNFISDYTKIHPEYKNIFVQKAKFENGDFTVVPENLEQMIKILKEAGLRLF